MKNAGLSVICLIKNQQNQENNIPREDRFLDESTTKNPIQ